MRILKRSLRYISRKKGKTIILFTLLLLMGIFVLSALIVNKAAITAQMELRKSISGSFSVNVKYSGENPYYHEESVEDSTGSTDVMIFSTKLISDDFVNKVSNISGVKYCDARTESLCQLVDVKLNQGTIPIEDEFKNQQKIVAVHSSETISEFTRSDMRLVGGRHITSGDQHVILLSKTLAELNNFKVGDKIFILDTNRQKFQVELIGIFETDKTENVGVSVTTYDKIENRIYSDLNTLIDIENDSFPIGYDQLLVTVNDPKQIKIISETVKKIPEYDSRAFETNMNDDTYQASAGALEKAEIITKVFLYISIAISIMILTLVLTMWSRERIHETGIYLGCGISKGKIIFQYLLEALLIGSVAFSLACIPGKVFADKMGEYIISDEKKEDDDMDSVVAVLDDNYNEDLVVNTVKRDGLDTKMDGKEIFALYTIGGVIIILAVGFSSIYMFRLKPREILSKMS